MKKYIIEVPDGFSPTSIKMVDTEKGKTVTIELEEVPHALGLYKQNQARVLMTQEEDFQRWVDSHREQESEA